jgi:molybdopterin synthase catalytic subunit
MMRSLRIIVSGNIIVLEAKDSLDSDALLRQLDVAGCGAIVSFLGITRPQEGEHEVYRLEFDAWEDKLSGVLYELANQAIEEFGVLAVGLAHRIGSVDANEPIVAIHVGSAHRKEAFLACEWLIDTLKVQAPLWKKEVTSAGSVWKEGLG